MIDLASKTFNVDDAVGILQVRVPCKRKGQPVTRRRRCSLDEGRKGEKKERSEGVHFTNLRDLTGYLARETE